MKKWIPSPMTLLVLISYTGIASVFWWEDTSYSIPVRIKTDTIEKHVIVGNLHATAIDFLKKKEGYCSKPTIACDGHLTIGYGHLIKKGERFSYLSKEDADSLLREDLTKSVNFVKKETKLKGNKALAFGLLVFNIGGNRFLKYLKQDSLLISKNIEKIKRYCHYKVFKDGQTLTVKSKALLERREFEIFIYKCYDF